MQYHSVFRCFLQGKATIIILYVPHLSVLILLHPVSRNTTVTDAPGSLIHKLQLIFPSDEAEVWVWSWRPDHHGRE